MKEADPKAWQQTVRGRVLLAAALLAAWALVIQARLVWLQVYCHDELVAEASAQKDRTRTLMPRRGDIVDRAGRILAISVDAVTLCGIPKKIDDPVAVADAVCEGLGDCTPREREAYAQRLSQKQRASVYLRRQVPLEVGARVMARVAARALTGIFTESEPRRYYPNRELAAHVLGYVGIDHQGLSGVEQSYNSRISGTPGSAFLELARDRKAFNTRIDKEPIQGDTLELTIDAQIQFIAERELQRGVAEHRASGGSVIVMDPRTGEILAMANYPPVNPNFHGDFPRELWMNPAVQGIYEPGSTFKIVTASAALEERVFKPSDLIDASAGVWRLGSRTVTEAKRHNYGVLSFTNVLVKSSNIGAIKIGLGIGAERLGKYVRRFGFGERVSGDLPGETRGQLSDPRRWSTGTLASVSMGYEIGVTPLQMAAAVSAVANGGSLLQPRLVRALRHGSVRTEVAPRELRRAIDRETAATLVAIMEQVVSDGTAKPAQVPGYTVAGKTGTAQKIVNRRYSNTDYNVSFAGFVPSRQPAFTILVVIDTPRGPSRFGSTVAAPIFQRIAEAALRHAGVPPTINPLPPVLLRASAADAPSSEIVRTMAAAGPPQFSVVAGPPAVPDVRGLGAREAARRLARLGLVPQLTGNGIVIDQDPVAGAALEPGRACRLWLGRVAPALEPPPQRP
ncbi:MAG: penicillin-binding transpeptidase domain-containing protein [Vicinamibacterales bacterium]